MTIRKMVNKTFKLACSRMARTIRAVKSNSYRSTNGQEMQSHDRGNSEKAFFPLPKRLVQATRWDTRPLELLFSTTSVRGAKKQNITGGERLQDMHLTSVFLPATCSAIRNTLSGELQNATEKPSELALDLYARHGKAWLLFLSSRHDLLPSPAPSLQTCAES